MSTTPRANDSINAVLTVDGKQLQEANCFYSHSSGLSSVLLPVSGDLGGIPQSAPGPAPVSRTKLLSVTINLVWIYRELLIAYRIFSTLASIYLAAQRPGD